MTDEEIRADIGDKLSGCITSRSAAEVRRITAILCELGYRWKLLYTVSGSECIVAYHFDPH